MRSFSKGDKSICVHFERPPVFDDIKTGDSIAVNGVCLTVEKVTEEKVTGGEIRFSLGHETLRVLQWNPEHWLNKPQNMERSLRLSDRIHGHFVSGHVEGIGLILKSQSEGDNWMISVEIPENLLPFVWKKGSMTFHGVSLTVNEIRGQQVDVCLVPETQKRTNLTTLQEGERIYLEPDYLAKALYHFATHGIVFPQHQGGK